MKKFTFLVLLISFSFSAFAQSTPKVGDQFIIKAPKGEYYKHIDFPKLNILVKRGQLASYKPVTNILVKVEEVTTTENNTTQIVLIKNDGTKFFNLYKTVKANYLEALKAGELELPKVY